MSMRVILDGREVESNELDPRKHVYTGIFRHANPPDPGGNLKCPCGQILTTREQIYEHWQHGHFDIMVYQTVKTRASAP